MTSCCSASAPGSQPRISDFHDQLVALVLCLQALPTVACCVLDTGDVFSGVVLATLTHVFPVLLGARGWTFAPVAGCSNVSSGSAILVLYTLMTFDDMDSVLGFRHRHPSALPQSAYELAQGVSLPYCGMDRVAAGLQLFHGSPGSVQGHASDRFGQVASCQH